MTEQYNFDWAQEVHITDDAPEKYRPQQAGIIVGMRMVQDAPNRNPLYQIEFYDGKIVEIPEEYIQPGD